MAEEFRVLRPREYHTQLVAKGHRSDGRKLDEIREIKLETSAIKTADSSSLIKLGSTSLVCGCTAQLVKISERIDELEEVKIKVELPPICSGPLGNKNQNVAQILTRTLKSILNNSSCIDKESLHVSELSSYWSLDIEVICLNFDGCLLDASLIAILSALRSLTLKDERLGVTNHMVRLNTIPICSSFSMIGNQILSDPNMEEETVAQTNFSITVDSITNDVCHINKFGGKSLHSNELFSCIKLAKERANKLKELVDSVMPSCEIKMDCT